MRTRRLGSGVDLVEALILSGREDEHFTASGLHDLVVRMAATDPPFDEMVTLADDSDEAVERIVSG